MRSSIPCVLFFVALLGGCRRDTSESPAPTPAIGGDAAKRSIVASPSPAGTSFADWTDRLDELLPLTVAATAVQLPPAQAETTYRAGLTLEYRWPSDRIADYAGLSIPVRNRLKLGVPRAGVTRAFFRSRFAPIDDTRREAIERGVERQATDRGLDEAGTDIAKALTGALSKRFPTEDIEGIADDAVWELGDHGQTLHLLHNGSSVTLDVDISADPAINKAVAIELAKGLIARL